MTNTPRPYQTPSLTKLGSVDALTLGGGHGSGGTVTKSGWGHDGGGMKKWCYTPPHHHH